MRRIYPTMPKIIIAVILLAGLNTISGCTKRKTHIAWEISMPVIGSQSSPRTADLNKDGILDVVIGAGKNEEEYTEQGILALDGKTGVTLWEHPTHDQVYGAATFYDITGEGTPEVFIGGRSPVFKALNGETGQLIWSFVYDSAVHESDPILRYARYNFNSTILVPDRNNNGFPEIVAVNGGNSAAAAHSLKDRYPGVLFLFDSKTGDILAKDTMPDGMETYMSPVGYAPEGGQDFVIIFGSGGETFGGHLYQVLLNDLMRSGLSSAKILVSEQTHGFIASPVLADITGDGHPDVVAISHASKATAVDGRSHQILWEYQADSTECSNSFAVGQFTDDDVPDFFTFVSQGVWPDNTGSLQILLDGKTGKLVYQNNLGCTGFSSPIAYDLNHDGQDEAIISINEFDCERGFSDMTKFQLTNRLVAIDFKTQKIHEIERSTRYKNIFTTPWIGDLDGDHYLDIIHCQYYSPVGLVLFLGMKMKCISTSIKLKEPVKWGAYLGSRYDGVYKN